MLGLHSPSLRQPVATAACHKFGHSLSAGAYSLHLPDGSCHVYFLTVCRVLGSLSCMHALQGLKEECYDLLGRLLEVDPDKRISVQQVLKHPWFTQDMPDGLQNLNDNLLQIPLSMQTGSCRQSEEELSAMTAKAAQSRRPRMSSSFGSGLSSNQGSRQLYY